MTMMNEKIWQAAHQQLIFRQLVNAFSYPGSVQAVSDKSANTALSVLATLVDNASSLSDPHALINETDLLRLQVQLSPTENSAYIFCAGQTAVDFLPSVGTLANPDKGATLVIKVDDLENGSQVLQLTGPGIKESNSIAVDGLHASWLTQREEWNGAFPLGIDMILVAEDAFVAIPRTTQIKEVV